MGSDATAFASLTHEKPLVIGAQDDGSETVTKYDGASWVVTRKDLHSGLITRFTQTGDSAVGTIEIMQGKSVSASWSPSAFDHPQGPPNPDPKAFYSWQGSEDKGPVLKTLKAQPLPKEMRGEFSAMHIAAPWIDPRAYEGIYPGSARREVIQENRDMAARLNAEEAAHKPAKTVGPHQSRPQGVPVSPH